MAGWANLMPTLWPSRLFHLGLRGYRWRNATGPPAPTLRALAARAGRPGRSLLDNRARMAPSMSWDDVHRLELHLRARAAAIGGRAGGENRCPGCGRAVEDDDGGVRLGGVAGHPGCLPALQGAPTL